MPNQISVVHVDDDPAIRDLTATFLERESDRFAVKTAASADGGMNSVSNGPPDCIVSDYNMPGMDGIELLQTVREEYPDLPFILFTGKGSEAVASEAIAADATDYLQKGAGSEQYELLANRIRNAVQARREAERADRQEQLMRLTEFAGDTGGFELHTETGEMLLTEGLRQLIDLPAQADLTRGEALDRYHPEDRGEIQQAIDRACQTGEQTHGTWRLQAQDGDNRLVDVTFKPTTTDGDTKKLRGAVHDITEHKKRQQELKRERRFVRQALDALEDLFYVIDTDGTLRRWNEKAPEVTGYSESELDGMPAIELFPESERKKISRAVEATLTDGEETVEAALRTADGQRIPYEFTGARLTDDNGNTTGLVGMARDLTDRKQHKQELERTTDLMSNTEQLAGVGAWEYDPAADTLVMTDGARRIHGLDPDADPTLEEAFGNFHPDDRELLTDRFDTCLETGEPYEIELRLTTPDGEKRRVTARGERVKKEGSGDVLQGHIQDVTEQKHMKGEGRL